MITDKPKKNDSVDETKPIQKVIGPVRESSRMFLIASCFSYRVAECFESRGQD